jgi:hypothetical protein
VSNGQTLHLAVPITVIILSSPPCPFTVLQPDAGFDYPSYIPPLDHQDAPVQLIQFKDSQCEHFYSHSVVSPIHQAPTWKTTEPVFALQLTKDPSSIGGTTTAMLLLVYLTCSLTHASPLTQHNFPFNNVVSYTCNLELNDAHIVDYIQLFIICPVIIPIAEYPITLHSTAISYDKPLLSKCKTLLRGFILLYYSETKMEM